MNGPLFHKTPLRAFTLMYFLCSLYSYLFISNRRHIRVTKSALFTAAVVTFLWNPISGSY